MPLFSPAGTDTLRVEEFVAGFGLKLELVAEGNPLRARLTEGLNPPLLAIVTFRPEFVPHWVGRPHVTLISLNRLPRRLRAQMIAHVTGGKILPKEISDQITAMELHIHTGDREFVYDVRKETDAIFITRGAAEMFLYPHYAAVFGHEYVERARQLLVQQGGRTITYP